MTSELGSLSTAELSVVESQGKVNITRLPTQKPRKSDLWLSSTKGVRTNTNRRGQSTPQATIVR